MHDCLLSCSVFFCCCFWLCWVLISACEIQFPDQGSNSGPQHWERRVLSPGPKFPLKLGLESSDHAGRTLAQRITEFLLNCCACSGIPRLQHSFWKLTELSTTWKPKPDMIPISNCFQLTEEQVKKKKFLCLVCSPTSLDPEMWNEGSDWKQRADTVTSRGIKPAWILCFHCSDLVLFFHLPLPSYALFVEASVLRCPAPSVQDSRLFGGNLCLPPGGCSDIPPIK